MSQDKATVTSTVAFSCQAGVDGSRAEVDGTAFGHDAYLPSQVRIQGAKAAASTVTTCSTCGQDIRLVLAEQLDALLGRETEFV